MLNDRLALRSISVNRLKYRTESDMSLKSSWFEAVCLVRDRGEPTGLRGIGSKVSNWLLVARKREPHFWLEFPLPTATACIAILTMPFMDVFDEAFAQRPDLRQRILGTIGRTSLLIGPPH